MSIGTSTYYGCTLDITGNENCTETRQLSVSLNSAPDIPANFAVQDGEFDYDTDATPDTHALTPYINWTESDPEGDDVLNYVCIATTADNRNNDICDIHFVDELNETYLQIPSGNLTHEGSSKSYYIRIISTDGQANSSALDKTFNIINNVPTMSSLNITTTHDNTPTMSWNVYDSDNGSKDKWPADSLTHYIVIDDASNGSIYSSSESADNNSYTSDLLPWGDVSGSWANRTLNVTMWAEDGNDLGTDDSNYTVQFTLYDYIPDIEEVFMTDIGAYSSCNDGCAINPISGNNATIAMRVYAWDTDDDCESYASAWLHLCIDTGSCNETNADFKFQLTDISSVGSNCTFELNSSSGPEFWRLPNASYTYHINVTSQAGERLTDIEQNGTWQFNSLQSIDYASTVYFGSGEVNTGEWNNGTSLATLTNFGNVVLNLSWNVTNPTNGSETWVLNQTDIILDDDTAIFEDNIFDSIYLSNISTEFIPSDGIEICLSDSCNSASINETLDTYYHVYPLTGLGVGNYTSTITIVISGFG